MALTTNRFPQIIVTLPRSVQAAVRKGANLVAEDAKKRAPDAPPLGEGLVEAIHVKYTRQGVGEEGSGGYLVVAGNEEVFYGHMVEFGTSRSAAQPFLLPAGEAKKDEVAGLVTAALKAL